MSSWFLLFSYDTWFEGLAKEYKKRDLEVDFPNPAPPSTILTIPVKQRLQMLRNLCDFHLEQPEHFWTLVRDGDAEEALRQESIGIDAQNRRYWIFSDARMYRDKQAIKNASKTPEEIEDESNWELVCLTRADYEEFFANGLSSKPKDRSLIKLIRDDIFPNELEKTLNYQLNQHRKYFRPVASRQEILLPRKRSSRLVEKEIIEMQRREMEEAERKERERQEREARAAMFGRDVNLPPVVPVESADLAALREQRARERELKKEREAQVKAIEEAVLANLNAPVDITEDDEPVETEKPSPIKLVLKLNTTHKQELPVEVVDILQSTDSNQPSLEEPHEIDIVDSSEAVEPAKDKESIEVVEPAKVQEYIDVKESDKIDEPAVVEESSGNTVNAETKAEEPIQDSEPIQQDEAAVTSSNNTLTEADLEVAEFLFTKLSQE